MPASAEPHRSVQPLGTTPMLSSTSLIKSSWIAVEVGRERAERVLVVETYIAVSPLEPNFDSVQYDKVLAACERCSHGTRTSTGLRSSACIAALAARPCSASPPTRRARRPESPTVFGSLARRNVMPSSVPVAEGRETESVSGSFSGRNGDQS